MRSTIMRPSPVPAFFVVKNGRNIFCMFSGLMPHPLSETESITKLSSALHRTVSLPPLGMACIALRARL